MTHWELIKFGQCGHTDNALLIIQTHICYHILFSNKGTMINTSYFGCHYSQGQGFKMALAFKSKANIQGERNEKSKWVLLSNSKIWIGQGSFTWNNAEQTLHASIKICMRISTKCILYNTLPACTRYSIAGWSPHKGFHRIVDNSDIWPSNLLVDTTFNLHTFVSACSVTIRPCQLFQISIN